MELIRMANALMGMAKPSRAFFGALLLVLGASTSISSIAEMAISDNGPPGYHRVNHDGHGDGKSADGKTDGARAMHPQSDDYGRGYNRGRRGYDEKRRYGGRRYGHNSRRGRKYGHSPDYGDRGYGHDGSYGNRGYGRNRDYGNNRGHGSRGYGHRGYDNNRGYGNRRYGHSYPSTLNRCAS